MHVHVCAIQHMCVHACVSVYLCMDACVCAPVYVCSSVCAHVGPSLSRAWCQDLGVLPHMPWLTLLCDSPPRRAQQHVGESL